MIGIINLRLVALPLILVLLLGCGRSQGQPNAERNSAEGNPKKPDAAALAAITAPAYKKPAGALQECLGRLLFEVGADVQWPTYYNGRDNYARMFSAHVFNSGDVMSIGNVKIAVFEANIQEDANYVKNELPTYAIRRLEGNIKEAREFLAEMKSGKRTSVNPEWAISRKNSAIEGWSKEIAEFRSGFFEFDPQVLGGEGIGRTKAGGGSQEDNYSEYRAFITRGKYIFMFGSTRALAEISKENHAREFVNFLKKFRARTENEIPAELGVCIPYGFIQDDGRTLAEIKQSFRMPDAPGVLYTIHTGSNDELSRSAMREAFSFASVGEMGTEEDKQVAPFITERIKPRPYKIGGMTALQGGVAAKIT